MNSMNNMSNLQPDCTDLIHAFLDGRATDAEMDRLNELLRTEPAAREEYVRLADMHSCLAVDEQLWVEPVRESMRESVYGGQTREPVRPKASVLGRPLPAAVVGLAVGLLCASLAFGYVVPMFLHLATLVNENFESGPAPLSIGMPSRPGVWSGDSSEVVGPTQGVTPHSGGKMLRLLRADYPGKSRQEVDPSRRVSYVADQWQLINLRPYKSELAAGNVIARLSAAINAAEFPVSEAYRCSFSIYVLDAETAEHLTPDNPHGLIDASLAAVNATNASLDRDPRTWQIEGCELHVPADASYLMVRVGVTHAFEQRREDFPGHFIDDVKLTLDSTGIARP
jgi:hypothetical protein